MSGAEWSGFRFEGIGTSWEISTPAPLHQRVRQHLLDVVEEYDRTYSRFRRDSLVAGLTSGPQTLTLPPGAEGLARIYSVLYRLTSGTMTPLIGSSLEKLGYGPGYGLKTIADPVAPPHWEDVLEWNGRSLRTTRPVVFDIGAAGKGQLVDLLGDALGTASIDRFIVDGSGDMLHSGRGPVEVALEHPYDRTQAIGTVLLENAALCASAANRRAWGDGLHHVLDGATGRPVETVVATWTIADNCMTADALATALFLAEPSRLAEEFDFEWLQVFSNGSAAFSRGFEGRLFT
ncbi:FAD:protein FMN transferase [Arthrobacter sp. M4]|uniref:FAD:protein FMN transferase n=1 Tax=Arthrobacter sp. M4 TaxID=218160 RepID=UPI001CDC6DEB|nr:FAD:protein FMN transferase [Arthrobacter sp. M4]MCA4132195.1 FAD:protein FMN transferase [Arthrobacter sp. M4]